VGPLENNCDLWCVCTSVFGAPGTYILLKWYYHSFAPRCMILTLPVAWCSRILLEKRKGTKWSYSQGDKCRHAGHLSREWRLWSGTLRISSSPACSNRMCLIKRDPSSRDTLPAGNPVIPILQVFHLGGDLNKLQWLKAMVSLAIMLLEPGKLAARVQCL